MNWSSGSFQFESPEYLLLATVPLLAALYFLTARRKPRKDEFFAFSSLQTILRREIARTRSVFWILFLFMALGLMVLAVFVARPVHLTSWTQKHSPGIDIAVVLDVSDSMEATDLKPNRISAARGVIRDFIRRRETDRVGLVLFGGESVTKVPLTADKDFLLGQVDGIELRQLKQGTAIGMGLASGIARLRKSESKTKVILLITDGDSNVGAINPITAANLARQEGIKIYTVGIGKENRVVVPIYSYDMYGRKTQLIAQVPSYINPELLAKIARITGGKAYMARDNGMLNRILQEIDTLEKSKVMMRPREKREEIFLWPTLGLFILFSLIILLQETRFRKVRPAHGF